jgi:hypothetical protein
VSQLWGIGQIVRELGQFTTRVLASGDPPAAKPLVEDYLFSDDLPEEARQFIQDLERRTREIKERVDRDRLAIRDAAERECAAIRARADAEIATLEATSASQIAPLLRELFRELKVMQVRHAQAGDLDEALAIRAKLKQFRREFLNIQDDPGNLSEFSREDIGRILYYEVVGNTEGSIWGHECYTSDSRLATAAIHAGVLSSGERGVVRVTLIDGDHRHFSGTERFGVRSLEYSGYSLAYTVEPMV